MDRPRPSRESTPSGAWIRACLPALGVYALLAWRFDFLCDDAFISFRYGRHLAQGEGLVFNLGRRPPVEGYTNFLWVLWCALFERAGLDVTVAARVTSAACGALLLALLLRTCALRLGLRGIGLAATGIFLATLPPMALWATGGLETMAVALAVFLCWERLLADPERPRGAAAGAAALAAALLRADGALWPGMILGSALFLWLRAGRPRALARAVAAAAAVLALGVAAHVAWRHAYYGEWVPQTARVKVGLSAARLGRGLDYLATFLLAVPSVLLLLLASLRRYPAGLARFLLPSAALILGSCLYVVWIGGDFMPLGRFLFPAVPFLGLLFAVPWVGFESAPPRARLRPLALGLALPLLSLLACFDVLPFPRALLERFHFRLGRAWRSEITRWEDMRLTQRRWSMVGRALALHTAPGESILLAGIGAQSYPNELFVYDYYGLVTPEVLEGGRVRARATPGHDLAVPPSFFFPAPYGDFHAAPTYYSATIVAEASAWTEGRPPWWSEGLPAGWEGSPLAALVDVESYRLPVERGFPEGAVLLLLRFRWARR